MWSPERRERPDARLREGRRAWAPRTAPRAQAALADARIPLVEVAQGDADGDAELELDDDPAHATRLDTARVPLVLTVSQARRGPAESVWRTGGNVELAGGAHLARGLYARIRRAERVCWSGVLLGGCRTLHGPAGHAQGRSSTVYGIKGRQWTVAKQPMHDMRRRWTGV